MSISAGTILKVVATALWLDGNINQNVFTAVITNGGGPWDEADVVADALTWIELIYGNLTAAISDELDGSQIQVYEYDAGDDDFDEVGSDAWVWNPTNTDQQLPRGVAGLINAKSLNPDVSGKKYIGGMTEGNVTDGLWPGAVITMFGDVADDWGAPFVGSDTAADWAPVIWSPTNIIAYPMTEVYVVPAIPAYQRRRKRGVGV